MINRSWIIFCMLAVAKKSVARSPFTVADPDLELRGLRAVGHFPFSHFFLFYPK